MACGPQGFQAQREVNGLAPRQEFQKYNFGSFTFFTFSKPKAWFEVQHASSAQVEASHYEAWSFFGMKRRAMAKICSKCKVRTIKLFAFSPVALFIFFPSLLHLGCTGLVWLSQAMAACFERQAGKTTSQPLRCKRFADLSISRLKTWLQHETS